MKPTAILAPAALLLASPAVAQDCKVCGGPEVVFLASPKEMFAEFWSPQLGNSFTAEVDVAPAGGRRFAGQICYGARSTNCQELAGTVSEAGQVTIVVGEGQSGFTVNLEMDELGERLAGSAVLRGVGEYFAEMYVSG